MVSNKYSVKDKIPESDTRHYSDVTESMSIITLSIQLLGGFKLRISHYSTHLNYLFKAGCKRNTVCTVASKKQ